MINNDSFEEKPKMKDPIKITVESYEVKADEYIRSTSNFSKFPELYSLLEKFLGFLNGPYVLDIAFGSGRDSDFLSENGKFVIGIELAQPFIERQHHKMRNPVALMDMRWLGFAKNSFDGTWCCSSFLHIQRLEALKTLCGFAKILKPGGIMYIDLKEGDGEEWRYSGNISGVPRFYTFYYYEDIAKLFKKAGFKILFTSNHNQSVNQMYSNKTKWINVIVSKELEI